MMTSLPSPKPTATGWQKKHAVVLGCAFGAAALASVLSGCVVAEGVNAASHVGSGYFERINKQRALERVARDWCLTVRSSQVVPIYPMEEDVQPGDSYIVDTPIAELKSLWNRRGYLPIEHRFGRFQPSGYKDYYEKGAYGVSETTHLPTLWQFPSKTKSEEILKIPGAAAEPGANKAAADASFLLTDWPKAPRAGFPSYSFRIRRGESFNGALPVQGVPVMLGALGARDVSGSVTLTDAFTYGIDESSLRDDLYRWLNHLGKNADKRPVNKDYLWDYASRNPRETMYLRVVTRVYLVRSVNISLTNLEASDWKVSAGAPKTSALDNTTFDDNKAEDKLLKALEANLASHSLTTTEITIPTATTPVTPSVSPLLPGVVDPAVDPDGYLAESRALDMEERALALAERKAQLEQRRRNLQEAGNRGALNSQMIAQALDRTAAKDAFGGYILPGGTLQMMSATNKSISMKETFTRPLVIGYHALEFPIRIEDNEVILDTPVSTFGRLDRQSKERRPQAPTTKYRGVRNLPSE